MEPIGFVVAVQGEAHAAAGGEMRPLAAGDPVYQGDTLATGQAANIEIKFADGSILAQGPDASMALDGYVYDPDDHTACEQFFDAATGTFRMVTGAIAQANPEAVEIRTPLATIGIRGTGMDVIVREGHLKVGVFDYHQFDVVITTAQGTTFITDGNLIVEVYPDGTFSEPRPYTELEQYEILNMAPITSYDPDNGDEDQAGEGEGEGDDAQEGDGEGDDEPDEPEQDGPPDEPGDPPQGDPWRPAGQPGAETGGPASPTQLSGFGGPGEGAGAPPTPPADYDDDDDQDIQDDGQSGDQPPSITWDFYGTSGDDIFVGTGENEYINGGGGNDSLMGEGGDDYIVGGSGADSLYGGEGDDTFVIESGDPQHGEIIEGGTGRNVLHVVSNDADFSHCAIDMGSIAELVIEPGQTATFECSQISAAELEIKGGPGSNLAINTTSSGIIDGSKLDFSSSQGAGIVLGYGVSGLALDAAKMPESGPLRIELAEGGYMSELLLMVSAPAGGTVDVARCFDFGAEAQPLIKAVFDVHNGKLLGSDQDERLAAHDHDDSIDGGGGDDTLYGGAGNDTFIGGQGQDWYIANDPSGGPGPSSGLSISLSDGLANDPWGGVDKISGIEHVIGTDQGDTIIGGSQNNELLGDDGYDSIRGGGGDDTLYGGFGEDSLYGDAGNDWLEGGEHDDYLFGGTGDDTLIGGDGYDMLRGEAGDDFLVGSYAGHGNIYGGDGDDTITVSGGNNHVDGGSGHDVLLLNEDMLDLTSIPESYFKGMDRIDMTADGSAYVTLEEVDILGGADADILTVTGGDEDSLVVNDGFWTCTQVNAQGFFVFESSGGATLVIDPALGLVHFANTPSGLSFSGTSASETIQGSPFADNLQGLGGDDTIHGLEGGDQLDGGEGDDFLYGGDDGDSLTGGLGSDWLDGGEGNDNIFDCGAGGGDGDDTILGGDGDDLITLQYGSIDDDSVMGGEGDDTIRVGSGHDSLHGGQGVDFLSFEATSGWNFTLGEGGEGVYNVDGYNQYYSGVEGVIGSWHNDNLTGNSGDNLLFGQGGTDVINGGGGDDTLYGGGGVDALDGGDGADIYYYAAANEGGDSILTFDDGQDKFVFDSGAFDPLAHAFSSSIGGYDGSNGSFGSSDACFLFDTANFDLWYDSNGDLAGGHELIATINDPFTFDDTDIEFLAT